MLKNHIQRIYYNGFRNISHILHMKKNRWQEDTAAQATARAAALDPSTIPKFVSPLIVPPVYKPRKIWF